MMLVLHLYSVCIVYELSNVLHYNLITETSHLSVCWLAITIQKLLAYNKSIYFYHVCVYRLACLPLLQSVSWPRLAVIFRLGSGLLHMNPLSLWTSSYQGLIS